MHKVSAPHRVLVVDDNADMRLSMRQLLGLLGYEVETASDGNEALALHRANAVGILITDIFMAGKEGMETIVAFKREWPLVRVIAMSGGGERAKRNYLQAAMQIGADATLQKPFSLASLKQVLPVRL
jgi:DNA-binding NtrC family response regulator